MKYRNIPNTELKLSILSLGTMNFGGRTSKEDFFQIIKKAYDAGINCFDCANVYNDGKSEEIVGEAIRKLRIRNKTIITSKTYFPTKENALKGNSKKNIIRNCESSLKHLNTDTIDIYFLHRPDFDTPIEESLEALNILIEQGKIRCAASSTFPAWKIAEAKFVAEINKLKGFICEQSPYNILDRRIENELIPVCTEYKMGIFVWSPLAQGILAGNYTSELNFPKGSRAASKEMYAERISKEGIETANKLNQYLIKRRIPISQFSIAWLNAQKGISSVIIGPGTEKHLEDALQSIELKLNKNDFEVCNKLVPPGQFVSNNFNTSGWMKK